MQMFLQESPIFRADLLRQFLQIVVHEIQDTRDVFPVLGASIEFIKHLAWIIDRGHGLVVPGVAHPRPWVGAIGDRDPELEANPMLADEIALLLGEDEAEFLMKS